MEKTQVILNLLKLYMYTVAFGCCEITKNQTSDDKPQMKVVHVKSIVVTNFLEAGIT